MADNKTSILLTADDRTRAAFESAKRGLMGLEAAGGRLNAVLGTLGAGALAGGGLLAFAKAGIDAADNINDLSQKIGIGVEQLSGYRLAAEQSGTSLEGFGTAARQLAKHIAENDPLLARLGVTSKDVNGALKQLADVFQALPDGADKTALAMKLMGRSGADMIPMLNGGGAALEKMLADGKALYGVTADMAKAADEFNDEMARMKVVTEAASVKVGGVLVKAFNDAVTAYQNFRKEHGALLSTLGAAGAAFVSPFKSSDAEKAIELQEKRNRLLEQARKIEAGSGSADVKASGVAVLRGEIAKLDEDLKKVWSKGKIELLSKDQLKAAAAQSRGDFKGLLAEDGKTKKAKTDKLDTIDPFGKQRQQAEADALRKAVEQQNAEYDAMAAIRDNQIAQEEQSASALGRTRDAMIDLIDPIQKYREELDKVDDLVGAGLFTPEQAAAARLYWQEQIDAAAGFGKTLEEDTKKNINLAQDLGLTFASAFEQAVVGAKDFQSILEGIAQDITRLFIRKTVTEPIAGALGDIFKGFDLGAIFGGGKAVGGPVSSGRAYLVGERGPELFVPPASGNIVPNNQLGGGRAVVINMNVSAQDAGSFRKSMGQIKADLAFAVNSAGRNM